MPQLTRNDWQNTSPARPSKTTSTTKDPSRLKSGRNFTPKRTTLGILVASLFTLGLAVSPAAQATDGIAEINETCAVQTGCFPGDSPGYPVTIGGQGGRSYRLTSDLIVPDENTDGIQVATSDVGIDLNNFSIIRAGCEGATANCTPASGTGSGIERTSFFLRGISVKNGSITGMGSSGVVLGQQSEVTGVRVRWNRMNGIDVRDGSTISGNTAYYNGDDGIFAWNGSTVSGNTAYGNGNDGIGTNNGSTVSRNTTYNNSGDGIQTNAGCNVQHNTIQFNSSYGLNLGAYSLYLGNAVTLNSTGTVTGSGSANSGGGNYCSGTGTGSSSCP